MIFSLILGTLLLGAGAGINAFFTHPSINSFPTKATIRSLDQPSNPIKRKKRPNPVLAPVTEPAHRKDVDNYIAQQQFVPTFDGIATDGKTMTLDNLYISPEQSHTIAIKHNGKTIAQVRQLAGLNQGMTLACGYYSLYHARILSFLENITKDLSAYQLQQEAIAYGLCNRETFFNEFQRMVKHTNIYQNAITLGVNYIDNAYLGYIGMITQGLQDDYGHIIHSINAPKDASDFESANNSLGISQNDFIAQTVSFIQSNKNKINSITMVARLAHEGSECGHFIAVRIEKQQGVTQITVVDSLLNNHCRDIAQAIQQTL